MTKFAEKKVLILGATAQTIPFIDTAKSMGVITYAADHLETSPAKKYADVPLLIDCFNIDALEEVVRNEQIDGIILGCADVLLPSYTELCERTGKYCYATKQQVQIFGNKKGLKTQLKKYGMPYIPEYTLKYPKGIEVIPKEDFPVFIKPVDNCSSKGMSVCSSPEELDTCCEKALDASRSKTILIEKYMICDDISITYTFVDGKVFVTSISDRYVNREQSDVGTITTSLIYPSKHTNLYFDTLHEKACRMFNDLKIKNGILTVQAFVDNGKIMFYDPAFRVTGGQGYIFYNYFNVVDQIKMLVEFSLTGKMTTDIDTVSDTCNFGSAWADNLVVLVKVGKIARVHGIDAIRKIDGVLNVTQCHFDGDNVTGRGTLDQTVARIHLIADSKEALAALIDEVLDKIEVIGEDGNSMLMRQFDTGILLKEY